MPRSQRPRRRLTRLAALATVGLALATSVPSSAAEPSTPSSAAADIAAARALFQEAVGHAEAGRWEESRDRYRRSLELHDDPVTRYSLSVANLELGHLVAARDGLVTYLRQTENDPKSEPSDELRHAARRAVAAVEPRIPTIEVVVTPTNEGALVLVDGEPVEQARVELDPGNHWIEVTAEGYARVTQDVALMEGEHRRISIGLLPVARTSTPDPATAGPPATSAFPTGPVVLMASGGVVGLTGLGIGLAAVARASGKSDDAPELRGIRRQAIAGDVLGVLGATTAAAGLVWWLASDDAPGGDDRPGVTVAVGPAAAQLRVDF